MVLRSRDLPVANVSASSLIPNSDEIFEDTSESIAPAKETTAAMDEMITVDIHLVAAFQQCASIAPMSSEE
jgi:hypothetical protein